MESIGPASDVNLKSVTSAVLKDVIFEVSRVHHHQKLFIDLKSLREKAEMTTEKVWNEDCLQAVVNEVIHIFRAIEKLDLDNDAIRAYLKKTYCFSPDIISAVVSAWAQKVKLSPNEIQTVDMGQVVDVKWKVGVSISSKNCKNLNNPFVTISLTLVLPGGTKCDKTFEMSISEFQNFHEQLLEMAAVLATV